MSSGTVGEFDTGRPGRSQRLLPACICIRQGVVNFKCRLSRRPIFEDLVWEENIRVVC